MKRIKKFCEIIFVGLLCFMITVQRATADVIDEEIVRNEVQSTNNTVRVTVIIILAGVVVIAAIAIFLLHHHKKQEEKLKKLHDEEERKESDIHY